MRILLVIDHSIAARYWMDVIRELNSRHELEIFQWEDDYVDYWMDQIGIPIKHGDPSGEYDVYLTSGIDKAGTIVDPKKIKAKRKIFLFEPVMGWQPLKGFDTAIVASEFGARRLLELKFSGRVVVGGYPPFEKACNSLLSTNPSQILVLTNWYYDTDLTKKMIDHGLIEAENEGMELVVKPHPYQRWRQNVRDAEFEYLNKQMIYYYDPNMVDIYDCFKKASKVICGDCVGGVEATLIGIPTYFHMQLAREWDMKIYTDTFDKHEENRKTFLDKFKTTKCVEDIIRTIEE